MDGIHTNMTNTRNTPVEVIETAYPLRVERYGLVSDSDGPGEFRGGLGMTREMTILDHATIGLATERKTMRPWGLKGGKPGGNSDCWMFSPNHEKQTLPSKVTTSVEPGTRIILRTAGGGGYGNPFNRNPEKTRKDVEEALISIDRARSEYGVVINSDTLEVDEGATSCLRKQGTLAKEPRSPNVNSKSERR
jgi:N-methylhydantoinase B